MALAYERSDPEPGYLDVVKQISGRRIEAERRRRGMSQVSLARKAGLGPAWIRQLEGGYAKVRLDDHLACLDILEVSPLTLLIPILFAIRDRRFPSDLLIHDLRRLELILIDATVHWNVATLRSLLGDDPSGETPWGGKGTGVQTDKAIRPMSG